MPIAITGLVLSSCGHIAHRAGVEPGLTGSVLLSPAYETYHEPPPVYWEKRKASGWEGVDIQGNLGYVWDIGDQRRLLFQGVFLIFRDADVPIPHSFDIYYQIKTQPSNIGIGLMVGLDPRFYFLWGKDYTRPASRMITGLDFGLGFAPAGASIIPQMIYGIKYRGFQPALIIEYRQFLSNREIFCDENCSDADNIRSRLSIGLVILFGNYTR